MVTVQGPPITENKPQRIERIERIGHGYTKRIKNYLETDSRLIVAVGVQQCHCTMRPKGRSEGTRLHFEQPRKMLQGQLVVVRVQAVFVHDVHLLYINVSLWLLAGLRPCKI